MHERWALDRSTRCSHLHPDDPKDEEDEAAEQRDVRHLRQHAEDRLHEQRHTRDTLERPQWPQCANGADDGKVGGARLLSKNGEPCERDDSKVELAPWVAEVRVLVEEQPVCEHLDQLQARGIGHGIEASRVAEQGEERGGGK